MKLRMSDADPDIDNLRKRLLWQATHRGIKEMDIIVGGYAKSSLAQMGPEELQSFAELLQLPDQDLLSWLTGQSDVPVDVCSPLLSQLLAFRPTSA